MEDELSDYSLHPYEGCHIWLDPLVKGTPRVLRHGSHHYLVFGKFPLEEETSDTLLKMVNKFYVGDEIEVVIVCTCFRLDWLVGVVESMVDGRVFLILEVNEDFVSYVLDFYS